jgi:precorrin-6A synthase
LRATGLDGAAVVMLDAECSFLNCPAATKIWWGAYLGTPDEILVAGPLREVAAEIEKLRTESRNRKGWIMDTYLVRRRPKS